MVVLLAEIWWWWDLGVGLGVFLACLGLCVWFYGHVHEWEFTSLRLAAFTIACRYV